MLMINVTLAHIEALSGQAPFDMRPLSCGPQQVAQLLDALREEGRRHYLSRLIPIDILYPALLSITLASEIIWFGSRLSNIKVVRTGIVFSVGAALFDYTENLGITAMILSWPNLSSSLVYAISAQQLRNHVSPLPLFRQFFSLGYLGASF
ncbi:MAG: hypothetical protein V7695_02335 [Sulfitobacter sp.]|jgi:hypothetical protein